MPRLGLAEGQQSHLRPRPAAPSGGHPRPRSRVHRLRGRGGESRPPPPPLTGPALVFTGSVGGTVNPALLTFNLTNRSGSLVWIVGQDLPWLSVSPNFGSLAAGGPATTVSVAPNLLASNLDRKST